MRGGDGEAGAEAEVEAEAEEARVDVAVDLFRAVGITTARHTVGIVSAIFVKLKKKNN
jgi:hypothetical protein